MTTSERPHVLIVGGGFGGLNAARKLRHADVDVTLLSRGTSHVFQPLLYQCATGVLSEGSIGIPLRHLLRRQKNAHVALGEAMAIDPDTRTLTACRSDGSMFDLSYDHLVVAAGMQQAYHGHDEYIDWAPGMKTLDDALTIRRKLITAFEMAESLPTVEERARWLTFAVAGGGPTGVEIAGQIRELALHALTDEFRSIDPCEARVLLFHSGDRVLPSFNKRLSKNAQRTLEQVGVRRTSGFTSPMWVRVMSRRPPRPSRRPPVATKPRPSSGPQVWRPCPSPRRSPLRWVSHRTGPGASQSNRT